MLPPVAPGRVDTPPNSLLHDPFRGRRDARSAAPAPGLVELVTSRTRITEYQGKTVSQVRREINRMRRQTRMRRCVVAHADSCKVIPDYRTDAILLTTTYAPDSEWSPRHMSELMSHIRKYCARKGVQLRYQWVIELTKRGVPHYHVLMWVPHGFRLPKPDDRGWWPHGSTRIELARKAVGYLVKYASKGGDDMPIPDGARLFGVGGEPAARFAAHRAGLPKWLNAIASPGTRVMRHTGVGWVEQDTGVVHTSPYSMYFHYTPDGCRLTVVERIGSCQGPPQ